MTTIAEPTTRSLDVRDAVLSFAAKLREVLARA